MSKSKRRILDPSLNKAMLEIISETPKLSEEEISAAIEDNIRKGHMVRNADGTFSLTEKGSQDVERMLLERCTPSGTA